MKFDSSERELSETIRFFFACKLNFIVIDHKQDLRKSRNYQFTKYFIKLGIGVCVCVCVCECVFECFRRSDVNGIILVCPYLLFQSKGKGKR